VKATLTNRKDLTIAIVSAVAFAIVWILLEFLFARDPSPVGGVLGGMAVGVAYFVGSLIFRKLVRDSRWQDS